MTRIMLFIGTRPEITKMAPVIRRILEKNIELILIHSGQHYDFEMSQIFLEELLLPPITENLHIGSDTQGKQTGKMLIAFEEIILKYSPNIILAQGDTNTVVATSLVCAKLNVPFGHVEAGIRSFDLTMPEEINRRLADNISSIHFAPTIQAVLNLYYEGIDPKRVFLTGNTIVDATLEHLEIAKNKSKIINDLKIDLQKPLITLTAHRPANVDNVENLTNICQAIIELNTATIVFSVHPRTQKMLEKSNLMSKLKMASHIILTEPLGYLDFLMLMYNSKVILTDSGGLQEEAMTLKKPCVTLRANTERPETVKLGVNFLVGTDKDKIVDQINNILNDNRFEAKFHEIKNPFGDGKASNRIVEIIMEKLSVEKLAFTEPKLLEKGSLEYRLLVLEKDMFVADIEKEFKGKVSLIYDHLGHPIQIEEKVKKGSFIRLQY